MDPILTLKRPSEFGRWGVTAPGTANSYTGTGDNELQYSPTLLGNGDDAGVVQQLQKSCGKLQQLKGMYSRIERSKLNQLRSKHNSYEVIGNGPFFNRAGVKLANIDAVFHVTGHTGGITIPQFHDDSFHFATLADGPGAFVEYLQFRNTGCSGVGITLMQGGKDENTSWNREKIDYSRFIPFPSSKGSGDLNTEAISHISWAKEGWSSGYNLVTGDGGFELENEEQYRMQEHLSSRLLISEAFVALSLVKTGEAGNGDVEYKPGGSVVLKIFGGCNVHTLHLTFLLSMCFDAINIFKPASSRPANAEIYCVCMFAKTPEKMAKSLEILGQLYKIYNQGKMVDGFLQQISQEYITWYVSQMEPILQHQITTAYHILKDAQLLPRDEVVMLAPLQQVDPFTCLLVWNLPLPVDRELVRRATLAGKKGERRTQFTKPTPSPGLTSAPRSAVQRGTYARVNPPLRSNRGATSAASTTVKLLWSPGQSLPQQTPGTTAPPSQPLSGEVMSYMQHPSVVKVTPGAVGKFSQSPPQQALQGKQSKKIIWNEDGTVTVMGAESGAPKQARPKSRKIR